MSSEKTVRVGVMPGKIEEYVVRAGSTVRDILDIAQVDPTGYQVKMDGETVDTNSTIKDTTSLILLTEMVKSA